MESKKDVNKQKEDPMKKLFLYIWIPAILAWLIVPNLILMFGYADNEPAEVAKKLEEDFIYSPVRVLSQNDNHHYQIHLYSYEETKNVTRYGIVQSHKLGMGEWVKPRELKEKEKVLNGFFLLRDPNVLAFGGYNPDIANSAIIEVENKSLNKTWKREVDLPSKEFFLITKELPHDFSGQKPKITYLDSDMNDVTDKVIEANQINK